MRAHSASSRRSGPRDSPPESEAWRTSSSMKSGWPPLSPTMASASSALPGAIRRDELRGERAGVTRRESRDAELADLAEATRRAAATALRVAHRGDEEEDGRIRGAGDLAQEREAVGVGPLQIVDDDDDRPAVGEADEQLAQRGEDARAQLLRVEHLVLRDRRRWRSPRRGAAPGRPGRGERPSAGRSPRLRGCRSRSCSG